MRWVDSPTILALWLTVWELNIGPHSWSIFPSPNANWTIVIRVMNSPPLMRLWLCLICFGAGWRWRPAKLWIVLAHFTDYIVLLFSVMNSHILAKFILILHAQLRIDLLIIFAFDRSARAYPITDRPIRISLLTAWTPWSPWSPCIGNSGCM